MRYPLAWAALGCAAAVFCCSAFASWQAAAVGCVAAGLLCCAGGLLIRRLRKILLLFGLFCMLGVLQFSWMQRLVYEPAVSFAGKSCTMTAVLLQDPEPTGTGSLCYTLQVTDVAAQDEALHHNFCLLLYSTQELDCVVFDQLQISCEPLRFETGKSSDFDPAAYYKAKGIYLKASARDAQIQVLGHSGGMWLRKAGYTIRSFLDNGLFGLKRSNAALLRALLFGDKSALTDNQMQAIRASGLAHALAVSGMHLSVLVGLLVILLGFLGCSQRSRAVGIILLVALYSAVAGFSLSVLRAAQMHVLCALAALLGRDYDSKNALFGAVGVLLLARPFAVFDVGLWLSFAATLGIVTLSEPVHTTLAPLYRRAPVVHPVAAVLVPSFCAQLYCLPLLILFFGQVPLYGLAANLLVVPLLGILFVCGIALACFSSVWLLERPLQVLSDGILNYINWLTGWISRLPGAVWEVSGMEFVFWGVYVAALVAAYLLLPKKPLGKWLLAGFLVSSFLLVSWLPTSALRVGEGEIQVTFLDVGQGDCILIQGNEGAAVIDCGSTSLDYPARELLDQLHRAGVKKLDYLILTHAHDDHVNGATALLEQIPVGTLLFAKTTQDDLPASVLEAARQQGAAIQPLLADFTAQLGTDCSLTILQQHLAATAQNGDLNDQSLVVYAACGVSCMLFCGDLTEQGERALCTNYPNLSADVLKVAHHGSALSSGWGFLREVQPQYAVISCGINNSYGLPDEETLARLSVEGIAMYRTDEDGTVIIRANELGNYRISEEAS